MDWKYLSPYQVHLWVLNKPLHVIELCHLWPVTQLSSVFSYSKDVKKTRSLLCFPSLSSSLFAFLSPFLLWSSELVECIAGKKKRKQIVQRQRRLVKKKAKIKIHSSSALKDTENSSSLRQTVLTWRSLDSGIEQSYEQPESKAFQVLWNCPQTGILSWQNY